VEVKSTVFPCKDNLDYLHKYYRSVFDKNFDNLHKNHFCTEFDEILKGDFHHEEFKYTRVRFEKCSNSTDFCANDTEISEYLIRNKLELHYIDTYIDAED